MHPALATVLERLGEARRTRGLTYEQLESKLLLGPGWIEIYESGFAEPPLSLILAVAAELDVSLDELLQGLDLGDSAAVIFRRLRAQESATGIVLYFLFGSHEVEFPIDGARLDEYDEMLRIMMDRLRSGQKTEAVADAFLFAASAWPSVNPSDLWYFIVASAFHDPYNYPAASVTADLAQSWKRTSGWALERVFMSHFNPALAQHELAMIAPSRAVKEALLAELELGEHGIADKADILLVHEDPDGTQRCFGVAHVKASFAERRTDDVPFSQALIERGLCSPLLTMDCKGTPSSVVNNRGELGSAWTGVGPDTRGQKRRDIEVSRKFDSCFSFNFRTEPTPPELEAAARIYVCSLTSPERDPFVSHVVLAWERFNEEGSAS